MKLGNAILSSASAVVTLTLLASAVADTNIVSENFDGYADQAAFEAVWRPDTGTGYNPTSGPNGLLVPNTGIGLTAPNDDPPGVQGQAINISVGINEYDDDNNPATEPFQLVPSATQSVQFSGDIFSDTAGNKRTTIGLRNDTVQRAFGVFGYNFIELGQYQAATDDPTVPGVVEDQPVTDFAYRVVLFDSSSIGAPLVQEPNWQYFPLDIALDTVDASAQPNPDGLVTPTDIGVGWHRYTATVTETTITLELDLYRDGLTNSEATEGVGTPGVDSTVTWTIAPTDEDAGDGFDFDPFTSLRIGSPSGIGSLNEAVVDNISLDLIDVVVGGSDDADFNSNTIVDGADMLIWQQNFGVSDPLQTDGDANADDAVDGSDLTIWNTQYGAAPPAVASASAVPEPTSALLGMIVVTMGAALRRRA